VKVRNSLAFASFTAKTSFLKQDKSSPEKRLRFNTLGMIYDVVVYMENEDKNGLK
jgi:hypothetical protein